MATKKTLVKKVKPLTKLQLAERRVKNLEWAISSAYNNFDELFALLCVYRTYIDHEHFSKYTAKNALNGIFTNAIHIQTSLMDEAGMEY
jgi:maltooligosyltrehalose synthase